MSQLLSEAVIKSARKAHACSACWGFAARPGESYKRQTYLFDDRVYDWITCVECQPLTNIVWEWAGGPDEGVNEDDFLEWARDHEADPKHGEAAHSYLARHNTWYRAARTEVSA